VNIAIDDCNEAARLAADAGLDEIKAFAKSCLAQIYLFTGRLRDAIETGERALASSEALGNLWWACRTIWHLNPAAMALGEWNASFGYCRRALEYGAILKDLRIKVVGLWRTGETHIHKGDPERGVQYCNEALALGALPYDAAIRQAAGDLAMARELLDRADAIFQELGTLDEPARVEAARAALDRGARIRLLDNLNIQIPAVRRGLA
jgi:tetratricopeptide (TPR) repeat protein